MRSIRRENKNKGAILIVNRQQVKIITIQKIAHKIELTDKTMFSVKISILIVVLVLQLWLQQIAGNPDAKRLYDDLLSNYNRLIRPVRNNTETVLVKLGLRLSQLIDLVRKKGFSIFYSFIPINLHVFLFSLLFSQNLKDQILTTNVWLEHVSLFYSNLDTENDNLFRLPH